MILTTEPDRRDDNPDLSRDECRILKGPTNGPQIPALWSYCRGPVVNTHWQLCQKHEDDRTRMIAADEARGMTYMKDTHDE